LVGHAHAEFHRAPAERHFRNDVYNQDEQLLEAIAEEAAFFSNAGSHPLTAHMVR
jgi:hypothetical protein